jgi:hypothetical protein
MEFHGLFTDWINNDGFSHDPIRTNRPIQVSVSKPDILENPESLPPYSPGPSESSLLTDSSFILKPDFNPLIRMSRLNRLRFLDEVFLKVS